MKLKKNKIKTTAKSTVKTPKISKTQSKTTKLTGKMFKKPKPIPPLKFKADKVKPPKVVKPRKKREKKHFTENQLAIQKQRKRMQSSVSRLRKVGYEFDEEALAKEIDKLTQFERTSKKRIEYAKTITGDYFKKFAKNKDVVEKQISEEREKNRQVAIEKRRENAKIKRKDKLVKYVEEFEESIDDDALQTKKDWIERLTGDFEEIQDVHIQEKEEGIVSLADVYMSNFHDIYKEYLLSNVSMTELEFIDMFRHEYRLAEQIWIEDGRSQIFWVSWMNGLEWLNDNINKFGLEAVAKVLAKGYELEYWKGYIDYYVEATANAMLTSLDTLMMEMAPEMAMPKELSDLILKVEPDSDLSREYVQQQADFKFSKKDINEGKTKARSSIEAAVKYEEERTIAGVSTFKNNEIINRLNDWKKKLQ